MATQIQHYGWLVSPYSAKTRSCLKYKRISFQDRVPSIFDFYSTIQKSVGRIIMPTVKLPNGTWLQDSSHIIDEMEESFPERSVVPTGSTQQLASLLLELFGDEWLPMAALHYRWNIAANAKFAITEFSRSGLPWLPTFLGRRIVKSMANKMKGYLPVLGVTQTTQPGVERMVQELLIDLNAHLTHHPFLLGGRPCIGDFALFGPLWAHLYRDPGSTYLFDDAPEVVRWMNQLLDPAEVEGDFLPDDKIPETLDPILKHVFNEQIPWVTTLVQHINTWCTENPEAKRVRGAVGTDKFTIGGIQGERKLATFVQWKAQRPVFHYKQMNEDDRLSADTWIKRIGAQSTLDIDIQFPFERRHFKAVIANR